VRLILDPEKYRRHRLRKIRRRLLRAVGWTVLLAATAAVMWVLIGLFGSAPPPE
jgi:hypothetical protein